MISHRRRIPRAVAIWTAAALALAIAVGACSNDGPTVHDNSEGFLSAPGAPVVVGHFSAPLQSVSFTEPALVAEGSDVTVTRVSAAGDDGVEIVRTGIIELPLEYQGDFYSVEDEVIPPAWKQYLRVSPSETEVRGDAPPGRSYFVYVEARLREGFDRGRMNDLRIAYSAKGEDYELVADHSLLLCERPVLIDQPCSDETPAS